MPGALASQLASFGGQGPRARGAQGLARDRAPLALGPWPPKASRLAGQATMHVGIRYQINNRSAAELIADIKGMSPLVLYSLCLRPSLTDGLPARDFRPLIKFA